MQKISTAIPDYWRRFRDEAKLVDLDIEIPDSEDLSGVSADIKILDDDSIECEMNEAYPGCVVQKDGFIPVGGCQIGTGDPYFIRVSEGEGGALYRIYHDSVFDSDYSREEAVDLVLSDYRDLLKFTT